MRAVFVDANVTLAAVARRIFSESCVALELHTDPNVRSEELPGLLAGAEIALIDHTRFPVETAKDCPGLRHVVFLGTGARSYMDPEALAELGITVHTIAGYGDTAVAEMTLALMWAASKLLTRMDNAMRQGNWLRTDGMQLSGKTLGLIGFGGIAKEVARLAGHMRILAWNRTPRQHPGVTFVDLKTLLGASDIVSLHLLLNDETRGFLSAERIAWMRPGAILVNTARGALVNEAAMMEALRSGALAHAGLDVYTNEPLPASHALTKLENVTLSAHSAFRTSEASDRLIGSALEIVRRISAS